LNTNELAFKGLDLLFVEDSISDSI